MADVPRLARFPSVDGGLREQNKTRTRSRLVEIALSLFEAQGFDEVTVEVIADAALVSPRTFYRYFGTKEGVLYDDQDHLLALVREAIVSYPAEEPPVAALRAGVLVLARHSAADVELTRRRVRLGESTDSLGVHRRTTLVPLWEQTIAEAIALRLDVDVDVDSRPRLLAGVGIAVMTSMSQTFRLEHRLEDLEALVVARFADLAALVTTRDESLAPVTGRPVRTGPG